MANSFFGFKQFTIYQDKSAMKVTTDGCLFGAWVAKKISEENTTGKTMLDIGSGTGLLSLMIAQKTNLLIDAVEVDKDSFQQAKENIAAANQESRINVFNENIKKYAIRERYDYIICNPPFYENELQSPDKAKNIAHHSTDLKHEELLIIIRKLLDENGCLFLLLPFKREKEIEGLFAKNECTVTEKVLIRQSTNHSFFRTIVKGSFRKYIEPLVTELSIRDDKGEYTKEFIELLKDYYLYL